MLIRKASSLVGLCFAAFIAPSLGAVELKKVEPTMQGFSVEGLDDMNTKLKEIVDQKKIPGFVSMVARKGEIVFSENYGFQNLKDKTPIKTDSLFRIYSMTKAVVSVAALTLFEDGKYKLDDPVSKYIPAFKSLKVYVSGDGDEMVTEPLVRDVTVRHLFTHTAGFTYHFMGNAPVQKLYRKIGIMPSASILGAKLTDHAPSSSLEQFIERLVSVPLMHQPGAAFSYGVSVDVLAYLVEIWSGEPIADYLEKKILEPLDMHDTAYEVANGEESRFMANYAYTPAGLVRMHDNKPNPYTDPAHLNGGGAGLVSTARDYLRFTQMIAADGELDGHRIISKETVDLMRADHLPDTIEMPQRQGVPAMGFGLGFAVNMEEGKDEMKTPKGLFFWGGAASTYFWVDPVNDISVVFMTQVIPSNSHGIPDLMRAMVYDALVTP